MGWAQETGCFQVMHAAQATATPGPGYWQPADAGRPQAASCPRRRRSPPPSPIIMFDWPAVNQTSPTSTSWMVTFCSSLPPAETTRSRPLELAGRASRVTRHLPLASAAARLRLTGESDGQASPGVAHPQTGTGRSRCSTMWSEKTFATRISARAIEAERQRARRVVNKRCCRIGSCSSRGFRFHRIQFLDLGKGGFHDLEFPVIHRDGME